MGPSTVVRTVAAVLVALAPQRSGESGQLLRQPAPGHDLGVLQSEPPRVRGRADRPVHRGARPASRSERAGSRRCTPKDRAAVADDPRVLRHRDDHRLLVPGALDNHAAQRGRVPVGEAPGPVPKEVSPGYTPFVSCRARSVRRRCVHGHEEERYPAGIRHVVARPGGDHDDRLAPRGLLEDPEKPPAVGEGVDDVHQRGGAVAAARSALTAAPGSAAPKIAEPATRVEAPSSARDCARSAFTPPSTETSTGLVPRSALTSRIFRWAEGMKDWPPNPGFTDITSTRSSSSSTNSRAEGGVDGFKATPAFAPSSRI